MTTCSHAWTWLLVYHNGTNNLVQVCSFTKQRAWTSLSAAMFKLASSTMSKPVNNTVQAGQLNHVQACQQHCSIWPAQPWTSLSTILFKLASSTMNKPVNNTVQVGQLNHEQACQQHYSSWPVQPCASLSTTLFKLASSTMFHQQVKTSCAFLRVIRQLVIYSSLKVHACWFPVIYSAFGFPLVSIWKFQKYW